MTEINITEQFFKTFGIEPKGQKCKDYSCICCNEYKNCTRGKYSEITADVLLRLICIHNIYLGTAKLYSLEVEDLKKEVLQDLIDEQELREIKKEYVNDDLKEQVRSLFEEVE